MSREWKPPLQPLPEIGNQAELRAAIESLQAHEHECSSCHRTFGHPRNEVCPLPPVSCPECQESFAAYYTEAFNDVKPN
jgi:ribosomal protein L37AE/L43A